LHLEQLKAVSAPGPAAQERTGEVRVEVSAADQATHRTNETPLPKVPAPRLRVIRGLKLNVEYPIADGANYIGRWDSEVVEIDLSDQEPADRVWSSRRHALLTLSSGVMTLEDLHSLNGTFVNRRRLYPGQTRVLSMNDVILIGTVQLQVLV
jgi:pSer/pThr/pTyr-binding forkhead associated (FHA) protein